MLAQVACLLEVTARKPGNVHRYADFEDASYLDFTLSAAALRGPMDRSREVGVGRSILEAVESTRGLVSTNTNLGMVLLLAPLCASYEPGGDLAASTRSTLDRLTLDDARFAYRAIRLARPGGLGEAREQDVSSEPTVPLREAMALAADRDLIALQYVNGYAQVFEEAVPSLRRSIASGQPLEAAIIDAHVALLADHPDTLILRKCGPEVAAEASLLASLARKTGSTDALDAFLRADGHSRNPGATADLVCASLFAALADGTIALPFASGPSSWSGQVAPRSAIP
jgi:triphosphoribosyl-dephospho-CoA synthase